ncbi:hypothetical protein EVAR_87868_1 [Eumeta japonica]|uniref:Uncharacterized protein n=1 Tax=Eumeta variegata TaxID=151549 RepID=A0A4C1WTH1_EUMVA|nr:hypothetical protein EVAR_87868_1 [Eumeta japonica]
MLGPKRREAGERGRVTRTSHTNPCSYALHRKNTVTVSQGSRTPTISSRYERTCVDVHGNIVTLQQCQEFQKSLGRTPLDVNLPSRPPRYAI